MSIPILPATPTRHDWLAQWLWHGEAQAQAMAIIAQSDATESPPYPVSSAALRHSLQLYLAGVLDEDDLETWALVLELRPEFDIQAVEGFVFALAHPEQMGGIVPERIQQMLALLAD